ncbi:MAG: hypothetical protein VZR36_09465, partial [Prevotella sp.]|nr:hypothetical protein [Prevotella sp.]
SEIRSFFLNYSDLISASIIETGVGNPVVHLHEDRRFGHGRYCVWIKTLTPHLPLKSPSPFGEGIGVRL